MVEKKKIVRLADVGELEADLKKDLAEEEAKGKTADILYCESISDELSDLGNLPTIDPKTLRPVAHWDMIIAFVPCTKTSNAGARHLYKGGKLNLSRYYEGLCGKALFLAVWAADCEKVVIENPVPSKIFDYPKPTQAIQPYEYGHPYSKKTLLWERGVPPLHPTNIVEPTATWCPSGSYSHKHGEQHKGMFTTDRAKNRAKTFTGVAKAMADQWG